MNTANPINPQRVFWELSPRLPDNVHPGLRLGLLGELVRPRHQDPPRHDGVALGRRSPRWGPAMPYAIAAKFAFPDRPVVAMVGDGAMQMNGINELITVAKYWQEWKDPRLVVLVLNNRDLNQVTWEQRAMSGDPKFEASQDLPDFPYAAYAESLGFAGSASIGPSRSGRPGTGPSPPIGPWSSKR